MADNLTPPGFTGKVATDEVVINGETAHIQRVKLDLGAENSSDPAIGTVPVRGTVDLGPTTLAALETITLGGAIDLSPASLAALESVTVGGSVELGAASLAALENISVGGTVDLSPASLAALETITVGGTVDLSPASLAALESITVGGTVDLSPAALAALESITVGGTVELGAASLAALETVTAAGVATETTLAALNNKIPAAGQALMAASQPVVIASNQTAIPTLEPATVLIGAAAQTAVVNNILSDPSGTDATDVSNFRSAAVQVVSTGTGGTFIFEQSLDGVSWVALPVFNAALVTGVPITAAITASASQIIYTFPIRARFLRLRIATAITGGSIRAFTRLSTEPWTAAAQLVASNAAGNMLTTATVTGYPTAAASADALANPTVTKIDATGLLFNGTTWDRARNNINVAVEASSAKTASGNGAAQTNFNARGLFVWINVTAVSGTTPTLTVRLQWSPDGGTTWLDLDTTNAQTVSITATGQHVLRVYPGMATAANASLNSILPRTWRLAWTIGGTTPSFTFAAQAAYVN